MPVQCVQTYIAKRLCSMPNLLMCDKQLFSHQNCSYNFVFSLKLFGHQLNQTLQPGTSK